MVLLELQFPLGQEDGAQARARPASVTRARIQGRTRLVEAVIMCWGLLSWKPK